MANRQKGRCRASRGFTLIELMIVVAIVSILAAIAYPSYQNAIRTARRADAMDAVLSLQNSLEKWRANHVSYAADAGDPDDAYADSIGAQVAAGSVGGHYSLALAGAGPTAYTLTVTAQGSQADDKNCAVDGVINNNMTLTVNAANPGGMKGTVADPTAAGNCWRN
ncbi:MAG: pilus assembly protein [Cellvibrionales bacterium]|nr:MAG: pilus assembly protein [Cellvibrionales bacterium]